MVADPRVPLAGITSPARGSFKVPLASTGVPVFFLVLLPPTWPPPPSRVHAPPCSPRLASRVTTVCIENPGDQLVSCHEPSRIADNTSPTSHNHQKTRGHHSSSPALSSRVKPCGKSRTASRLRGLIPAVGAPERESKPTSKRPLNPGPRASVLIQHP
jgi:hypothetical protein